MSNFKLTKKERLCNPTLIGRMFEQGESFYIFPLKVVFLETPLATNSPVQISFSASKKNFKRAVHRNLLKRRMREAYRLNKPVFYSSLPGGRQLAIMIVYAGKEIKNYQLIEKSMIKILQKLADSLDKKRD